MKPTFDPYQQVTDRIVASLENGVAPWVKPWRSLGAGARLRNAVTNRPYHGLNVFLLGMSTYTDPRWLTYRQAQALGGHVRKGERGTQIVFWKMLRKEETDETGKKTRRTIPLLRLYTVFNVQQCDELKLKDPAADALPEVERDAQVEAFMQATGAQWEENGFGRACYVPALDRIEMPHAGSFADRGCFYGTLLHELTHWTGHPSRCDRTFGRRFGDDAYAMEELVAEMGSAFLCQRFEVDGQLQHPEYLAHWLKVLRADKRAIFTAASKARAACTWLYEKTGYADMTNEAEEEEVEQTSSAS